MISLAVKSALKNRQMLFKKIDKARPLLIKGDGKLKRTKDTDYPFRQNSDFMYFSACNYPDLLLLLFNGKSFLFIPETDIKQSLWTGNVRSKDFYRKNFQFDDVFYNTALEKVLNSFRRTEKTIMILPKDKQFFTKRLKGYKIDEISFPALVKELRPFKNNFEFKILRKVAKASSESFNQIIKQLQPGMYEYQLAGIFRQELLLRNIRYTAFPSIVAAGPNASVLHYEALSDRIKKNDLCLIDAGGELCGYASDITRTVPVSGRFNKKQKDIYEIVLSTQKKVIKRIKPGITIKEIHDLSLELIGEGLLNLGIIKNVKPADLLKAVKVFYPHGVSHLLGIDTHDTGPLRKKNKGGALREAFIIQKNMVLTVEPGIYFNKAFLNYNRKNKALNRLINWSKAYGYLNVGGIRIEDDVIVNNKGADLITTSVKDISDIEGMMNQL